MISVEIPGMEGRKVTVENRAWGATKLLVDGKEALPGPKRGEYLLKLKGGRQVVAQFRSTFLDSVPTLIVDGQEILLAPRLTWFERFWIALPIGCIFLGCFGAILAVVAVTTNSQIMRAQTGPLRWVLTGIISATAIGICYAVLKFAPVPTRPTG